MKSLFAGLMVTAVVVLTGCNQDTPGGPGPTPRTANKPVFGQADDAFSLGVPKLSTKLKQGETKDVAISVARGKNFGEDVTLKFTGVPKGVTLDPASPVIRHGDKEAKITLKVADNASMGDFTLKVTGEPSKGMAASSELKITVAQK
jgi:uncharacterized membrane protein